MTTGREQTTRSDSEHTTETSGEIQLSEEQEEWVKDNLGIAPIDLSLEQKQYIVGHWNQVIDRREYRSLFPPRQLTPEEIVLDRQLAQALQKLTDMERELDRDIVTVEDVAPREWLIDGIIPKKTITFIAGDKGIGKTTLILQMAACLMTGQPFLRHRTEYSRVFLVEHDEPMEGIRAKITRQAPKYPELT